jgi:hypothetical protein
MSKPIVKIKDAFVYKNRLTGVPTEFPDEYTTRVVHKDGYAILSSKIVGIFYNFIETENTIYAVENWITGV